MLSLFAHHISVRAIAFATIELCAFVVIFLLSRHIVMGMMAPDYGGAHRYDFLLPIFSLIAFCTTSACGLYNREMYADTLELVPRLLTVSALMYGLMALTISIAKLALPGTDRLWPYYAIALLSAAGYFGAALLFRNKALHFNFNNTLLERRVLVLGADDCAAKIAHLNAASRNPFTAVGFVPIGRAARSTRLGMLRLLPEGVLNTASGLLRHGTASRGGGDCRDIARARGIADRCLARVQTRRNHSDRIHELLGTSDRADRSAGAQSQLADLLGRIPHLMDQAMGEARFRHRDRHLRASGNPADHGDRRDRNQMRRSRAAILSAAAGGPERRYVHHPEIPQHAGRCGEGRRGALGAR